MRTVSAISAAIGAIGATLVTYDALNRGSRHGLTRANNEEGKELADVFMSHQSGSDSTVIEKLKKMYREYLLDDDTMSQFSAVKNVIFNCAYEMAKSALPLILATGAIVGGLKGRVYGTISAGLLLVGGVKVVFDDVLGNDKYV